MSSSIDPTKPESGRATTASVRANFEIARQEINALQATDAALSASSGSSLVGFIQSGTGAVARTLQAKAREIVSVTDFGAVGDGTTDDTAAIQAAINTGFDVDFIGGSYKCNNLTQSAESQTLYSSSGTTILVKNANGDHLTSTGDDFTIRNIICRGDASSPSFTGSGIVSSGERPHFDNCGAYWQTGRAIKATGGRIRITGTNQFYRTTATGGSAYDAEIGVSGTATLYHEIDGFYTGSSDGGILLTDTGSHSIKSGQFGKLTIAAGTSPSGVNGGKTEGARILGNVSVGVSSAIFAANQFSAIAFTFESGTDGCTLDLSNSFAAGATITNSGGAANLYIRRGTTAGSVRFDRVQIGNNAGVRLENVAGTQSASLTLNASDNLSLSNTNADKALTLSTAGASSIIQVDVDGVVKAKFDKTATARDTGMLLWDVDNATLERVTVGIADSGGAGFKVLRIPN